MTATLRASALHLALAAALLALAACSGGNAGAPTPPPPPACKGMDQPCGAAVECCSGDCPAGACGCSALSERCGSSADCCDVGSPRRCEAGACAAGARPVGDVCDWDGQCSTLNCDLGGHCAPACLGYGTPCTSSQQCCSYLGCRAGTCTLDCATGGACAGDNQCCSGYACRAGQCQAGACGTAGQACASSADCCTAAQGGKSYFCDAASRQCDLGRPGAYPGAPPDPCTTDADCAGTSVCRDGYCHWPDGTQPDGGWCLDARECDGGVCTSSGPGVPGTCCSGAGNGCVAGAGSSICCSPLTCSGLGGLQTCGTCLDFTNSGPQGTAETQCTFASQCCANRNLTCVQGECCTSRDRPCTAGSGALECCAGATCGDVTSYGSTTPNVCCGVYDATCGYGASCCDGFRCAAGGRCLKGPGQPCAADGECADRESCNPGTGSCCSHEMGPCASNADCCTGRCDVARGQCLLAQEYDPCLSDADCAVSYFGTWPGPVCGASAGPGVCCPIPGDTCRAAADCCEAGDLCQVPLDGSSPSARCCRATPSGCSANAQCCTGVCWSHYVGGAPVGTCCAMAWEKTFQCASDADCCDSAVYTPTYFSTVCAVASDGLQRCCRKANAPSYGDPATCCSGRVDGFGDCR